MSDRLLTIAKTLDLGRAGFTPATALLGMILLVGAVIAMVVYNERAYTEAKVAQVEAQAGVLAGTVTAALVFGDPKASQEYVNALRIDREIRAAGVYGADGTLVAGYVQPGAEPLPARMAPGPPAGADNAVTLTAPVRHEGRELGTVYIRSTLAPLSLRLQRYLVIAIMIGMASVLFLVMVASQRALAASNQELRNQIEERQRIEEVLRQAQKMEVIGQLTGGVAHDFNNLLQVIVGNLGIIQRLTPKENEQAHRFIGAAFRGVERGAALTQRLLAFSRRQPLNPRPVDLNRLVGDMSQLLQSTLGESIAIESVLNAGVWPVSVDPNQLESALLNLCVNARDAMPDGGRLTIETANTFLGEAYCRHNDAEPGDYVLISVTDTGEGMDETVVARAFEPFFTTKDVGKGSGLGLSQVYGFMKQSNGHVKIESEPGKGTTVKLYLPRLMSTDDDAESPSDTARSPAAGRLDQTILVVEDDDDVRAYSVAVLRDIGYTVLEAVDGPAALRILEQRKDIDLLFTDVGLPGMNGRQLADQATKLAAGMRVLFTSGYARDAIVHDGRLDRGVELITKPFTQTALAAKVGEVLR